MIVWVILVVALVLLTLRAVNPAQPIFWRVTHGLIAVYLLIVALAELYRNL